MQLLDGPFLTHLKPTLTVVICLQDLSVCKLNKSLWNSTKSPVLTWMWWMNSLNTLWIYSGWISRTFRPTDFLLTILADSPPKMLWLATLIFGMRCIHCIILMYLCLLPEERHQSALVLEVMKGPRVMWRWSKMGRGPTWVMILLKSKQYCTHQPIWRRQEFAVSTSAAMIFAISLQMMIGVIWSKLPFFHIDSVNFSHNFRNFSDLILN